MSRSAVKVTLVTPPLPPSSNNSSPDDDTTSDNDEDDDTYTIDSEPDEGQDRINAITVNVNTSMPSSKEPSPSPVITAAKSLPSPQASQSPPHHRSNRSSISSWTPITSPKHSAHPSISMSPTQLLSSPYTSMLRSLSNKDKLSRGLDSDR